MFALLTFIPVRVIFFLTIKKCLSSNFLTFLCITNIIYMTFFFYSVFELIQSKAVQTLTKYMYCVVWQEQE